MIELIGRLVLALVFAVAAGGKLLDLPGGRRALTDFGLPESMAGPGAIVLPGVEAVIAAGLVLTVTARAAAAAALLLLLGFVVAIARLMRAGRAPACHCFGAIHSEPVGASTLARNAALAAVALFVVAGGAGRSLASFDAPRMALIVVSVCAAGLVAAVWLLWREVRQLRTRPLRRSTGLPKGSPAPEFRLADIAGGERALSDELDAGRPALLVFVSPSCEPCQALLPSLGRWQRAVAGDLAVMVLSTGDHEANRAIAEEHGIESLLVSPGPRVSRMYQAGGTPSAVLIDAEGTVATAPAVGGPAVEALLRVALRRLGKRALEPAPAPVSLPLSRG